VQVGRQERFPFTKYPPIALAGVDFSYIFFRGKLSFQGKFHGIFHGKLIMISQNFFRGKFPGNLAIFPWKSFPGK
jgi:hypothetical protein